MRHGRQSEGAIIADEIDNYQFLGDVKTLLDVRRQTFGRQSKLFALSHPDQAKGLDPSRDWTGGIMSIYADSDRRVWYWPCPHCGAFSSPVPTAGRVMTLAYPDAAEATLDEVEAGAHLLCPVNGCVIEDSHRRDMNLRGVWIGEGQEIAEDGTVPDWLPFRPHAKIAAARRKQSGENPVSKEAIWTNYEKGAFSACNAPEDRA